MARKEREAAVSGREFQEETGRMESLAMAVKTQSKRSRNLID
ncbi:hypothetical protein QUA62_25770 [Microcoleus sp. MON1_C1]